MNFLLPQERSGTLREIRAVDIHSDRYFDLWIEFDEPAGETRRARVPVSECAEDLAAGDRVAVKFVMGVMVKVGRGTEAPPIESPPSEFPPVDY